MSLNPNPVVYAVKPTLKRRRHDNGDLLADDVSDVVAPSGGREPIDADEVFELIRHLADPEHPLTLEQLHVVRAEHVTVDDAANHVFVQFTPTIPHCSMATLIGLCLRTKLQRSLPPRFKVDVKIYPGTHSSEVESKSRGDASLCTAAPDRATSQSPTQRQRARRRRARKHATDRRCHKMVRWAQCRLIACRLTCLRCSIANTDPAAEDDDDANAVALQSTNFDFGVALAV